MTTSGASHVQNVGDEFHRLSSRYAALPADKRAAFRARLAENAISPSRLPIVRLSPRPGDFPLSLGQESLWFLWKLEPSSDAYNVSGAVRLSGALDAAAAQTAIGGLVARHEALRTRFFEVDGRARQRVEPEPSFTWGSHDLRGNADADAELARVLQERSREPFDLAGGPLLRAELVRLGEHEHVLLLAVHHIVCDGWSLGILLKEFVELYAAAREGRSLRLSPLPVGYPDVSLWQREWLGGAALEAQLAYWRTRLGGEAPPGLPADRVEGGGRRPGAQVLVTLGLERAEAVRRLARARGTTPFMPLFVAWASLLARLAGSRDVCVGVPVSGRERPETHGVVGFFVNTVALRLDVGRQASFATLLDQAKARLLEAQANQDVPISRIEAALSGGERGAHAKLFETTFNLQEDDARTLDALPGLVVAPHELEAGDAKFALSLNVAETAAGAYQLAFDYSCGAFDATTVEQIASHYVALLEACLEHPDDAVARVPLADAAEAWGEGRQWPAATVVERVAEFARTRRDEVAVVHEGRVLSWGDLWARAGALADKLTALGVGRESAVALCLSRSAELIVGIVATWRAGGAYVPLDPQSPTERLAWQLVDCGARVLVTNDAATWALEGTAIVSTDVEGASGSAMARLYADQAAYIVYTSGTTGRPKGVVVSHGALATYVQSLAQRLPEGLVSAAYASTPAADLGHTTLFGALFGGYTLHVIDEARATDPDGFAAYMREHRVEALKIVPSHLTALLSASDARSVLPIRCLVLGGETASGGLVARVTELAPGCRVINHYGPTETTVGVLTRDGTETTRPSLPLGRPLAHARVYLLDGEGAPSPRGAAGEICIGGEAVARGYLGRAGLTAERFVPDGRGRPGSRLYRTGDKGRHLASGEVEFLGRFDDQIKIRGYRVEPREVVARLRALAGVRDAAVIARPDARGRARLLGYVVGEGLEPGAMLRALAASLPAYMVPAALVVLPALPLTVNGKIDRAALPEPSQEVADRIAPRNETEAALLEVWRRVLGRDDVGVTDDFFALGGESILTLQVVALARKAGLAFTAKDLFAHPRIDRLAEVARPAEEAPAARDEICGEVPLTPIQRRFFERNPAGRAHWNQSVLLGVRGELERAPLEAALRALVARHDALRLRFVRAGDATSAPSPAAAEGAWVAQVVAEEVNPLLEIVDLRGLSREGGEDAAAQLEREAQRLQRGLNLEQGPLLKAGYFRTADAEGRLLLVVHHLAVDGVSWRILLDELGDAYERAVHGEPQAFVAAPLPWGVWASELTAYAQGREVLETAPRWRDLLREAGAPLFFGEPSDRRAAASRELVQRWGETATQRLVERAPRAYKMRVDEVLLGALAQTLATWADCAGALVEVEGHGREEIVAGLDPSRTVGWFTTRYPVWLPSRADDAPGEALKNTKEALRTAPTKGLSWGLLAYHADEAVRRSVGVLPRPHVGFNYLGRFDVATRDESRFFLAGEAAGDSVDPESEVAHSLELVAIIAEGALALHWRYLPGAIDETVVAKLAADFERRLEVLLAYCEAATPVATASDFPLAAINQRDFERLRATADEVQDVYPATALQQGLVFHDLLAPGQGVYVNQRRATLARGTDLAALRAAWEAAVGRHDILRTQFETTETGKMLQVVRRRVVLPYVEHDWRAEGNYEVRLAAWRADDLARGFDLAEAPLLRVDVFLRPDGGVDLVWLNHHAIFDGWSTSRLLAEIVYDYRARTSGSPARADEEHAPAPFRRFVEWYGARPSAEAWWRAELAGIDDAGRLADALGRPEGAEIEPGYHRHVVGAGTALSANLRAAAKRHLVTLNTMMQGAWALTLARFSCRQGVIFGVTVAGRPAELPECQDMLGPFINSLPCVVDVTPAQPVSAWLAALQQRGSASRHYEHTPLSRLQQWVGRAGAELFDSLLVYENYPVDDVFRDDAFATVHFDAGDRTHYPLTLTIVPNDDEVRLEWAWDGEKIARSRALALAQHYAAVLEQLAADRDHLVGEIRLQPPAHAQNVEAARPAYDTTSLGQRIAEQARLRPQAPAVTCEGEHLTYGELESLAARIGRALTETGVRRGERVGVCVERSAALVATCLGIWKAGAAYVPLDPSYPAERLRAMVAAGGLRHVVADGEGARRAGSALAGLQAVRLEGLVEGSGELPVSSVHPDELAYVIFTSGSTGEPKAVGISHRALAVHTDDYLALYGVEASDCVYQFATINFDTSVEQIFPTLAAGARLVMRGPGVPDWGALHDVLAAERVSMLYLPTAYWAQSVASVRPGLPGLRLVILAGEEMLPSAVRRWKGGPLGAVRLVNAYGPTELTVTCTMHETTVADGVRARVPIGRPHPSRRAYVLDHEGNEAPLYAVGELCVGGVPTARGYLERPGATADRFVPDPVVPGERAYRTGDLCRRLEGGGIEFLGRRDSQIKLRGYRIELGEVESALLGCDGVREAVAMLRGVAGARRLVGYVAGDVDASRVRAALERTLAPHMVPSSVVVLASLPVGASGKIDRAALPDPELPSSRGRTEPTTELERQLLAVWGAALERTDLGTDDNFFEAGGDSIISLQIVARARALGIRVTPKQVFERPTVAELAGVATLAASAVGEENYDDLPLTPIQAAFFERAPEGESHYNQSVLLHVGGDVSPRALEATFELLVARHASLRLTFRRTADGSWVQRVRRPDEVASASASRIAIVDLRGTAWQERLDEEGQRLHQSLDIGRGPLLRAGYFLVAEGEGRLLVVIHHLAIDGVSWRVLLGELEVAYAAALRGESPTLPAPSAPWTSWVAALATHAARDEVRAELGWWVEALAPAARAKPIVSLETNLRRAEGHEVSFALDAETTAALVANAPRAYRLRVDEVLLAALARTLAAPGEGVLIDFEGHGREDVDAGLDVSRTLGWFTTQFLAWFESSADDREALLAAKNALRSVSSRGLNFGLLAHMAGEAERAAMRALPRAQVNFNYLGRFDATLAGAGAFALARESAGNGVGPSLQQTHALDVSALIEGGALSVRLRFADALGVERVGAWASRFEESLRRLIDHCATAEPRATAADFVLAGLNDAQIDALGLAAAEDVYPATPAQQGLVFHTLRDREAGERGLYVDQFRFTVRGAVDAERLRIAWGRVLERYDVLRARFEWRHGGEPLQIVERPANVAVAFEVEDATAQADYEAHLSDLRRDDLTRGFDLGRAPLTRARLVRRPDGAHDLLWTIHHALLDGWSTSRVLGDVLEAYDAPVSPGHRERTTPFRHYIAWLRAQPSTEAWWLAQIERAGDAVGLLDGTRLPSASTAPGKLDRRLADDVNERLRERARRWRVTPSTLAQAAWALVLSRYTSSERVVFGVTVSGRPTDLPGVEQMVGLFINSLPLWVDLRAEEGVVAWLQRLQAHSADLRHYEHTSLRDVQRWSGRPGGDLFDTLLVFENYPVHEALRRDGASLDVVALEKADRTHYPLTLTVHAEPVMRVAWEWGGERVGREFVESLADVYNYVLEQFACVEPGTLVGELVVGEARPQTLASYAFDPVGERVARAARSAPSRIALGCDGVETTHGTLDAWATRVGRALRSRGLEAEGLVGLCVGRSAALVAALLGVWKAGGAFVPLDPSYPEERLRAMLAGVRLVVCDAAGAARLPWATWGVETVRVDDLDTADDGSEAETVTLPPPPHPEQLAYVLYTSGSTGQPKGVAVSHRSLSLHVDDFLGAYNLGAEDRTLFSSTLNFDVALHELLPVLTRGGRAVMRGEGAWDLDTLTRTLGEQAVTLARVPTALWQPWARSHPPSLPSLRQVTVGGEGLSGTALAPWFEGALGQVALDNLYGPTEVTVASHRRRVRAEDGAEAVVSIGHAFAGRSSYVLDGAGNVVPVGGVGELCIGGVSVARGYLGRAGATAERFVPDPFVPGGRLYRTGDRVRETADGALSFLGRVDGQVKLRGQRIELGEVEAALRACVGVQEAAAAVVGEGEGRRLVGYAVGSATEGELRAAAERLLPGHMVPTAFVRLEALPRLPNGKLDRGALPAPEARGGGERIEPRTALEGVLREVWQRVLKRSPIGVTENFFELGGDSILGLQVIARAREAGWRVTPKQVFEQPTVEALARVARPTGASLEVLAEVRGDLPLTPIQVRFFERYPEGLAHSNQSVLLRVTNELSLEALERALEIMVARHDALRLRFRRSAEGWRQRVAKTSTPVRVEVVDLRDVSDVFSRLDEEGARLQGSLDLERGPLVRAGYFLLPNDERRLLLVVHHLVVDGVSWRALLDELGAAYVAIARGEAPELPPPGTPWSAWALRSSEYAKRDDVRSELAWWQAALATADAALPVTTGGDRSLGASQTISWQLDADSTHRLIEAAPRAYRMRVDEVLLTAFAQTLAAWSGASGALVDLEGHGREDVLDEVDIGRTVGWFTTRFPVWLEANGDAARALKGVKERLRAVPHKGFHWGFLRHAADPEVRAEAAALPRAQVSFNYLGQFDQALDATGPFAFAGEAAGPNVDPAAAMAYLLDVNALVAEGALSASFRFSPAALDAGTASKLVEAFGEALAGLIDHCATAPRSATAADFPLARLSQGALERLGLPLGEVQDIYPATPLQQGLVFHSLARGDEGLYVYQLRLTMAGALDVAALRTAWQSAVDRYDVLRTHFMWGPEGEALQIVRRHVELPFVAHAASSSVADHEARLADFCREDVARGFDVECAPLTRVSVFARPDDKHDVVWTMHHALSDGWSSARIVGDIIAAYRAHVTGAQPTLAHVAPYREYVAWLASRPSAEPFWRASLQDLETPARLLPSLGRARERDPGTHRRHDRISVSLVRDLKELARRHAVTLSTLMQGAWGLVLGRYGNSSKAIFGVTVSGRPPELPGALEMVGLFINTLPVCIDLPPARGVGEWLVELQRRANELRHYEHTPLSHVQRWAGLTGDAFFDTLFTFENFPVDESARSADVDLRVERSERADRTHYPLTLTVLAEGEIKLEWEWDGDRVERARVENLAAHYLEALSKIASSGDAHLGELTLATAREQIVASYAFDPVGERVARAARSAPSRIALGCDGVETTHGTLDAWATRVGRALRSRGLGAEGLVGLCVGRSAALVAALLGVWKAGGAFVPLDPSYPEERLRAMLAGVRLVVCDAAGAARLPWATWGVETVRVDDLDTVDDGSEAETVTLPAPPHPEQLAYVLYTSGSTGQPKGVAVSHRSLSLHVDDFLGAYNLGAEDRTLFSSTLNFDVALHELLPVLTRGGRAVMRGEGAWDLDTLTRTLGEQAVTLARVPTALWQPWARSHPPPLPSLRQVTVGGEGLSGTALAPWFEGALGQVALDNLYGPTEVTVASHRRRVRAEDGAEAVVSIGHAFAGRSSYVLDGAGNVVPVGGVGELCIGGASVARGYLGRAGATAERFVPDPFVPGGRLYRTGDRVRETADGALSFLGRVDGQVKLRGQRIELGEVEAALRACVGVQEAAAAVVGEGEGRRLVGYAVGSATEGELRAAAERLLPGHMVPSAFVRLEALPRLPNGKLDRGALPAPEARGGGERIEPRTALEGVLREVWQRVLKRAPIGVTENFFELGGDSILGLQVIARAREAGWRVTPKQVFEQPTVEALARVARPLQAKRRANDEVVRGDLPLTPIQARFFERHPWGPAHWNQSILLRVNGELSVDALGRALGAIVARHDALRLRFRREGDLWLQHVADAETSPLVEIVDLRDAPDPLGQLASAGERVQQSLDLQQGPLLRTGYFLLPGGEARLLLTVHHLAVDGVSWRLLLEEIEAAYAQAERGEPFVLAETGTPWSAWAVRLGAYARRSDVVARLAWWEQALTQGALAARPPTLGEGDRRLGASRAVHWRLDREATEALLQAAPRAYRMRIDEVLLTALAQTLAAWTSSSGVLVHLEGHGREDVLDEVDIGRTVGWFTTRFPVWLEANGDAARALKSVKEGLRSVPDKGIDWGLFAYLGDDDVRARTRALPQPWVSFNYLGRFDEALSAEGRFGFADEAAGASMTADSELAHLLELNGMIVNGELSMSWRYSPGVLDGAAVERAVAAFDAKVRALGAHCALAEPTVTATDFTLARITQAELEAMRLPLEQIQDIYPATPLQQGLIFESLLHPSRGAYINQLRLTLRGELKAAALREAWASAVARHDILRTHFEWRHGGEALQVVHREAKLPFAEHDWSSEPDYEGRLSRWLEADLRRGFAIDEAPLLRANVFKRPDGAYDLIRTSHHALSDGWSAENLFGEILAEYGARCLGEPLPQVATVPYRNYIAWLQARPSARPFWEEKFRGVDDPAGVLLATQRMTAPREPAEPFEQPLGAALSRRLRDAAQRHKVTLNTLVQGAWALTLGRMADRRQAVFGATVSGRPPELEGADRIIGPFINTLPVVIHLPASAPVGDWLQTLQREATELRQYEYTPLNELQKWAQRSGDELFDSIIVFENYPVAQDAIERDLGLVIERAEFVDRTHYPLTLTVVPYDDEIKLEWSWDSAKVARPGVAALSHAYTEILESLAADGDRLLDEARARAPQHEPTRLVVERGAEPSLTLGQRIAEQARLRPQAPAVTCEGEHLTYGELEALAARIGRALTETGVRRGERVGVCVERSAALVATCLGIWKAGAAYVPLDPSYPAERLRAMVAAGGLRHVVADGEGARRAGSALAGLQAVRLEGLVEGSGELPMSSAHPDELAYVMFTSGSTGEPKAVGISHRALGLHADDYLTTYAIDVDDVVYQFATINFDTSVEQIFPTLVAGARLVMRGRGVPDWGALHDVLATERVSVINFSTAYWAQSLSYVREEPLPSLRVVLIGGEAATPDMIKRWKAGPLGSVRLTNGYGPTEVTVTCTVHETTDADGERAVVPIGRVHASRSAYVLDADGGEVPPYGIGELCIGGDTLARGYLERPDLTAERFVPDPLVPGGRLYRTGDVCRLLEDGVIEFLGRRDDQIKLRGHRIELGDIEAALRRVPGVREAVAALVPGVGGVEARLAGYLVGDATPAAVVKALEARLPPYMVPSAIVALEALPLLPNGKLDRRALPPPADVPAAVAVAPRTDLEAALLEALREVLGRRDVGVTDDFFVSGGDSLAALRLAAAARRRALPPFSLEAIFAARTAEGLARHIEGQRSAPPASVVLLGRAGLPLNLFCVHPLYGIVGAYAPLAEALDGVATVYGLQSPIYSEPAWRAASLDDLAREYVRRMRLVQPQGPYYLLGWSFGGPIVAAMAAELERVGEPVALVAAVDARADTPSQPRSRAAIARELEESLRAGGDERAVIEREARHTGVDADLFETALEVVTHHEALASHHRAARLRADVHVWLAARASHHHDGAPPEPHGPGWQAITSGTAHEVDVDATHASIVEHERLFSDLRALLRRDPAEKP